jgi:iron complex transport system ATP-binding protein
MSELLITDVSVGYGGAPVVRDVSLTGLRSGRLTALIGPNAAGKSTLMRAVAGLLKPTSGRVALGGEDILALPLAERARRIRFVPQVYATQARLTVFDLVLVARMTARQGRAAPQDLSAVERSLTRVGISALADRLVCHLSGGQQQLVALAQALARPAPVFLLDEPTSALDLRNQLEAIAIMRAIAAEDGCIVMAALHDLNLAARHADHLVLMGEGRVVMEGPPELVLRSCECGETYGVRLTAETTRRGTLVIEASL